MKSFVLLAVTMISLLGCQEATSPLAPTAQAPSQTVSATANSWESMTPMLQVRWDMALAAAGSYLYAIGGYGAASASVERYAYTGLERANMAPMPEGRYSHTARHIQGVIYVAGGRNPASTPTGTLFAYHIASNTWSRKASLPGICIDGASAVLAGKLYVFNGGGQLYRYDPTTDSWTTLAQAPEAHQNPALGWMNGKIYVAGGQWVGGVYGRAPSVALHMYDPATNTWTAKAPMLTPQTYTSGTGLGGKLYVVGGRTGWSGWVGNTLSVYDPVTNSWSSAAPMPTRRERLSVHALSGYLYAMGGRAPNTYILSTVERYTP